MEITYNLEKQDVINFRWYFTMVKPSAIILRIKQFYLLFITTISIIQIFSKWSKYNWLYHLLYLVISVGTYWIFFKLLIWLLILYVARQNIPTSGIVCQHTISLTSTDLIEKTNVNESRHGWEGVSKITENQDYLFIHISGEQIHIIPKRAFSDPEAYQKFYAFAQECYAQYHPTTN